MCNTIDDYREDELSEYWLKIEHQDSPKIIVNNDD